MFDFLDHRTEKIYLTADVPGSLCAAQAPAGVKTVSSCCHDAKSFLSKIRKIPHFHIVNFHNTRTLTLLWKVTIWKWLNFLIFQKQGFTGVAYFDRHINQGRISPLYSGTT